MPPPDLSAVYTTASDVEDLLSEEGVDTRLDDDGGGTVSAGEQARLTKICQEATGIVNTYLMGRYSPADLADSWQVYVWTTLVAARRLCKRRGNPVPESLEDDYKEALDAMKAVQKGELHLSDIQARVASSPAWSNVRVDPRYRTRKIRVERPISERTPSTDNPQNVDWPSTIIPDPP